MLEPKLRIQLISDHDMIRRITEAAPPDSVTPHTLSGSDQRLGIAEVAAIVAVVHSSLEIAKVLVKAFEQANRKTSITVRTPKGSTTIQTDAALSAADVLRVLEEGGIF